MNSDIGEYDTKSLNSDWVTVLQLQFKFDLFKSNMDLNPHWSSSNPPIWPHICPREDSNPELWFKCAHKRIKTLNLALSGTVELH